MRHYSSREFSWKKDNLYLNSKKTDIFILLHSTYENMYWVILDKEETDFYNLSRAKDNAIKYALRRMNISIDDDV